MMLMNFIRQGHKCNLNSLIHFLWKEVRPLKNKTTNKNRQHRIYSWLQVLDSQLYYEDSENTEVVLRQDPQLQGHTFVEYLRINEYGEFYHMI
jgi:hypothetical protein